jgi:co-chaperonin GroES (HSP10)
MHHEVDPKKKLKDEIGDLSKVEIFNNQVLVGVYIRPQKTKSGIYLTERTTDEDKFQGKIGLVLKKGNTAFVDPDNQWFADVQINENDWVLFRPSDGWSVTINGVLCRIIDDHAIRGRVDQPDRAW